MVLPSFVWQALVSSSASSGTDLNVKKETWDEERDRLIGYLSKPAQDPNADLNHALDVLDGKKPLETSHSFCN